MAYPATANPVIIDALFCIPKSGMVRQISDCIPFSQDLTPRMNSSGIAGAILATATAHHASTSGTARTGEPTKL